MLRRYCTMERTKNLIFFFLGLRKEVGSAKSVFHIFTAKASSNVQTLANSLCTCHDVSEIPMRCTPNSSTMWNAQGVWPGSGEVCLKERSFPSVSSLGLGVFPNGQFGIQAERFFLVSSALKVTTDMEAF